MYRYCGLRREWLRENSSPISRVSTDKQGRSGLGVEAQREAVARYLKAVVGSCVAEYVETESGERGVTVPSSLLP